MLGESHEANRQLGQMAQSLGSIQSEMSHLNQSTSTLIGLVEMQSAVIERGLERMAHQLFRQTKVLDDIACLLHNPYEAQVQELLRTADAALQSGASSTGRDREEDFNDARKLLQVVVDNPIGSRNFVAWFQIGWLQWKDSGNFPAAEESMRSAVRLRSRARRRLVCVLAVEFSQDSVPSGKARRSIRNDRKGTRVRPQRPHIAARCEYICRSIGPTRANC